MSRRTTLIRNKYLSHEGKTIEDYIAGKSKLVFRKQGVEGGSAAEKAFEQFAAARGVHADSRPMRQEKADRLRAYFNPRRP